MAEKSLKSIKMLHTTYKGKLCLYVDDQADGAIKNGSIIIKQNSEPEDLMKDGTEGTIIGSVNNSPENQLIGKPFIKYAYFVKWHTQDIPPVGILDYKLKLKE